MPQDAGSLPQPQQPDPQKLQQMMQLMQTLGMGNKTPAPLASGATPQASPGAPLPGATLPQTAPPAIQTKTDPMANMGSLPKPIEQPQHAAPAAPTSGAELLKALDPKTAATYGTIQGVTGFIQQTVQRNEQKKSAEAANAAQALMSALEAAKTTGDFSPAQHIFENNEALFNKVYKGWMQKEEESQKQQQKESEKASKTKKPDLEVQGFEQGLQQYLGKGGAKQPGQPQPPQTLQGKSGAKYYIPQASPGQALAQQGQSSELQAARQDPNRTLKSQLSSDEQRMQELGYTPEAQAKLQTYALEYAKLDTDLKKTQAEVQKAQIENDTELAKSGAASAEAASRLDESKARLRELNVKLDISKQLGQIQVMKAKNGGTVPASYKMRWSVAQQASDILDKTQIKDAKGNVTGYRALTSQESQSLTQLLTTAGAAKLASDVPGWYGQTFKGGKPTQELADNLKRYKDSIKNALSGGPDWLGSDTSSDDSDIDIEVKPEDLTAQ